VNDFTARHNLRRVLRERRRALSPAEQSRAAVALVSQLLNCRLARASRRVALYLPNDGEIDPQPFMSRLRDMKKTCYLPILSRLKQDRLWFAPYRESTPLDVNRFGIPEPATAPRHWVRAQELDLILMPLVAFDERGNRLGMGGGFYDKSLAFLRTRTTWQKPHLVGLAHDFQRVDILESCAWDVPLQAVVTDRRVYEFGGQ